jgi:hypothetical protein
MESGATGGRLMSIELQISDAWQQAAADLGLTVHVADGGEEDRVAYAVRVDNFGSPAGTVCRYYEAPQIELYRLRAWSRRVGLFVSLLAGSYSTYKRDLFLSTLDDWGWFGGGEPPDWYSGQVWGTDDK